MILFQKGIKQHDIRDCGAACLATICQYHGVRVPLVYVRSLCRVDKSGSNLKGIICAAEEFKLRGVALRGNWEELLDGLIEKEVSCPFIAHVIIDGLLEHYIIIKKITSKKVFAFDPANGNISYSIEEFKNIWTGYLVTFSEMEGFHKQNLTKGVYRKYISIFKEQSKILTVIVLISLLLTLSAAGISFAYKIIIDTYIMPLKSAESGVAFGQNFNLQLGSLMSNANYLFIALLVLVLFQIVFSAVRGMMLAYISKKIDTVLMESYLKKVLRLPMSYFNDRKTGEILSRFNDISEIHEAISTVSLSTVLESMMLVVMGIILYQISPILFLLIVIISVLYTAIVICFLPKWISINKKTVEVNAQLISTLKESIDGMETVKTFRAENKIGDKLKRKADKELQYIYKGDIVGTIMSSCIGTIQSIGMLLILWGGSVLVMKGNLTLGTLITFETLSTFFTGAVEKLVNVQPTIQSAIIAADRLNDVLEVSSEKEGDSKAMPLDSLKQKIVFDDVKFCYGYRQEILHGLNFQILPGEKVAIVGESGCGKTTLTRLLLRLYTPTSGNIKIGECSIEDIPLDSIRKRIAYISQNVFLFSDTMRANLTLGVSGVSEERIESVLNDCKLDELVENLPLGLDTIVDEEGKNLSGGQKQRVAIARAYLTDPDIIIFDEATSNLDSITEKAILDLMFRKTESCTVIIIAHRMKTIKNCDKILVLADGKVLEEGTHDELVQKEKYYFELMKSGI